MLTLQTERRALLPASRCGPAARLESHVLDGDAEEFKLGKVAGKHLIFESVVPAPLAGLRGQRPRLPAARRPAVLEHLGRLLRPEASASSTSSFQWNKNWWQYWTTDGLPLEAAYNTNMHITLKNNWGVHMGGTLGQLGTTYDDRAARGGPARSPGPLHRAVAVPRRRRPEVVVPYFNVNYFRGDGGRSRR